MNDLAAHRLDSRWSLAVAAFSMALVASGCDKAKEEPVPTPATVIMPGTPAPTEAAAASSSAPSMVASTGAGVLPPAADVDASNRVGAGNGAASSAGTLSVIPAAPPAPAPTTIVVVNPPNGTTPAPAPIGPNVSVLPPAISASSSGPGSIGPNPSASNPGNDQPPSYPPGTPPPTTKR